MSEDLERRLGESFRRASLPIAPDSLRAELERVTADPVAGRRRGRSPNLGGALGLAAVLALAGALAVTVGQRDQERLPSEAIPQLTLTIVPQPVDGRLPTRAEAEAAADVVRRRLEAAGQAGAIVTVVGVAPSLVIDLPAGADRVAVSRLVTAPGRIEFVGAGDFQPEEGAQVDFLEPPLFEGDAIVSAQPVTDEGGGRALDLALDEQAARILADFSRNNVGGVLAIVVDDRVLVAPTIQSAIPDGRVRIVSGKAGGLDEMTIREVIAWVTSGPLPVPLAETVRGSQPQNPVP